MSIEKVTFSVNDYDYEGDILDEGIYLHFGKVRVKVCDSKDDLGKFISHMEKVKSEIEENY